MGDRNAGEQRRRNRARDSRNDFAGDAGGGERERFFSAAAEDERIAALQPHDPVAAARLANHQPIDRVLANRRTAGALADEEPPRPRRKAQRLGLDERVVEHEVGLREARDRLQRQQLGIAGAGADERNAAAHFTSSSVRLCHVGRSVGATRLPLVERVQRFEQLRTPRLHRHAARAPLTPQSRGPVRSTLPDRRAAWRRSPRAADRRAPARHRRSKSPSVTPARRTTPPRYMLAFGGSSTAFTKMCRRSASSATRRFTSGGAAATTNQAPSRSDGSNGRATAIATPATESPRTPPARRRRYRHPPPASAASFDAATGPPPTTTTRRPCSFRNAGNNAMWTSPAKKQKSPEGFGLPGFGCVSLRWTAVQDINAWTEGREAQELHTAATITRAGLP